MHIAYKFGGCYTQTTERSPMDGGDDAVRAFPLQPQLLFATNQGMIVTANIRANRRARRHEGNIGSALEGKYNSFRERWRGTIHGTSFRAFSIEKCIREMCPAWFS
jgi:hypothetical protein